jgi:hypothetical protein
MFERKVKWCIYVHIYARIYTHICMYLNTNLSNAFTILLDKKIYHHLNQQIDRQIIQFLSSSSSIIVTILFKLIISYLNYEHV